jgi:hypothetical protein
MISVVRFASSGTTRDRVSVPESSVIAPERPERRRHGASSRDAREPRMAGRGPLAPRPFTAGARVPPRAPRGSAGSVSPAASSLIAANPRSIASTSRSRGTLPLPLPSMHQEVPEANLSGQGEEQFPLPCSSGQADTRSERVRLSTGHRARAAGCQRTTFLRASC